MYLVTVCACHIEIKMLLTYLLSDAIGLSYYAKKVGKNTYKHTPHTKHSSAKNSEK